MSAIVKKTKPEIAFPLEPDTDQWINRFKVKSSSSNSYHLIAQNKKKRYWACSCRGWIAHRKCRHLQALGIPCGKDLPAYEPKRLG